MYMWERTTSLVSWRLRLFVKRLQWMNLFHVYSLTITIYTSSAIVMKENDIKFHWYFKVRLIILIEVSKLTEKFD